MRGLDQSRIIVAGSATGIGAATARRLAEEGAHVYLADFANERASALSQSLNREGARTWSGFFDLYDEDSIRAMVADATQKLGGLDGIADVAAETRPSIAGLDLGLADLDIEIWEKTNRANLLGTALLMKHAIPEIKAAGGGAIVNVTSGAAQWGEEVRVAYGASKAGINSITRHVARVHGSDGIRANAVSPGAVLTETALDAFSDEMVAAITAASPLGRLGKAEDIANTIAFLLSSDADWVSGQVWSVNGGGVFRE